MSLSRVAGLYDRRTGARMWRHLETVGHAERWAIEIGVPAYAIDEQTAIQVVDGSVEVVSEGRWKKFGS